MPCCWPVWWRPAHRVRRRAAASGKQVVFDVGDPQGIDSMSPLIGVTVAAYEAWNIQYATLTDKAAKDFHVIPGLAESWEGSDDGLTWTYKLRPNLKWSDGKPLTAEDIAWTVNTSREEEWLNHSAVTAEPDRRGARRHDARHQDLACRTRSCRSWTSTSCPSTSGAR